MKVEEDGGDEEVENAEVQNEVEDRLRTAK